MTVGMPRKPRLGIAAFGTGGQAEHCRRDAVAPAALEGHLFLGKSRVPMIRSRGLSWRARPTATISDTACWPSASAVTPPHRDRVVGLGVMDGRLDGGALAPGFPDGSG